MKKLWMLLLPLTLLVAIAIFFKPESMERQKAGARRIAMLQLTAVDNDTVLGFQEAMTTLGYREGVEVEYLRTEPVGSTDRLQNVVREFLKKNPDLFVVSSTPVAQTVMRLTEERRQPPVIFAPVNDPLGAGIVADLRHPGGHVTGVRLPLGDDLRLQWLVRIVPGAKRIYLPYTADDKSALASLQQASEAAAKLGVTLLPHPVAGKDMLADVTATFPANVDAIFLPRDSRIEAAIAEFVALADQRRLPISAPSLTQVQAGALFSYGFVHRDIGRQAARLADQVLRGTPPGDLPVEMAENRLAINLVAASRIGIAIPDDIVVQAEYVIRK